MSRHSSKTRPARFPKTWQVYEIHNPAFNYGEFAAIKSQAGLNSYKISVKEWVEKQMPSVSAFFFKQWGTWGMDRVKRGKKANGRLLLGKTWSNYPVQAAAI